MRGDGARRSRRRLACAALVCGGALIVAPARAQAPPPLFSQACSACHGEHGEGVPGKGPSLKGAGAAAADFYLSTGRMPLSNPHVPPQRTRPPYTASARRQLIAYIASLGGPAIPHVDPSKGDLQQGFDAFTDHCAGCHTVTARGGVAPPGAAPALQQATATQIAEAVRVGPYLMPKFSERQIDQHTLDSITAYVLSTHHLPDKGGWGIGNIGPIPEGLVAWLLAGTALLIVVRIIGERR